MVNIDGAAKENSGKDCIELDGDGDEKDKKDDDVIEHDGTK